MKVIILALLTILSGCAIEPPAPFDYGEVVPAPLQCEEYQTRGGFCSLQFALDQVHQRFEYLSDNKKYPELRNFTNGYNADVWERISTDGKGDCEDFALTLRWYLNARGITGTKLLTIKVPGYGYHAALELDGWIMDNTSLFPRRRQDVPEWEFLTAGDETGVWRKVN